MRLQYKDTKGVFTMKTEDLQEIKQAVYEGTYEAFKRAFSEGLIGGVKTAPNIYAGLTPYQSDVLDDLLKNVPISDIAKKHGCTPQAIRNMRNKLIVKGHLSI